MADFTLDTSGFVEVRTGRVICTRCKQDHGVCACEFRSTYSAERATRAERRAYRWSDLTPFQQGYVEAAFAGLKSGCPVCEGRGEVGGWVGQTAESGGYETHTCECVSVGFSDLAPETLAAMLKDCEAADHLRPGVSRDGDRAAGHQHWERRQAGVFERFPPVTLYLGDDGKIYQREAASD